MSDDKTHTYFYLNRPGGISCQPDGHIEMASQMPKRIVATEYGKVDCFGSVSYAQPLAYADIWRYDLLPASTTEYARYMIWMHECDRDFDAVDEWLAICKARPEQVRQWAERYVQYKWAVMLMDAGEI